MSEPGFAEPRDLSDPAELAKECEDMAGGMDQQQIASQPNSALGGHPHPHYLYGRVAEVLRAAAKVIKAHHAHENSVPNAGVGNRGSSIPPGASAEHPPATASGDPKSSSVAPQNAGQADQLATGPAANPTPVPEPAHAGKPKPPK